MASHSNEPDPKGRSTPPCELNYREYPKTSSTSVTRTQTTTTTPSMYIGGGVPPIPGKLVCRIQNGQFIDAWLSYLMTTLRQPKLQTKINPRLLDTNYRQSHTSWTGYSALALTLQWYPQPSPNGL